MTRTGWIGEEPQEPAAAGFAGFIMAHRAAPDTGRTAEQVLAHAAQPDRPGAPYDDDRQAWLLARGYRPGMVNELSRRLGDVTGELEAEREKIERDKRRHEHVRRAHEAGQLRAWDIPAALGDDLGDPGRVYLLERRAEGLRAQLGDAMEMMAPPQRRDLDGVEAASRHARQVLAGAARERLAGAETRRPEPRPFGSASRGAGRSIEHTGDDCWVCARAAQRDEARARAAFAAEYGESAR